MKYSNLKAVFSIGLLVLVTMVLTAFRTVPPEASAASVVYEPGMLVKGRDHFIYYITEAGTRRPIYDRATFLAFGFEADAVVKADEELLAQIPLGPVLTRLVVDEGDNLYWVVNGQRRQVNLWKEVLANDSYQGVPTSPLDLSLKTLPSRGGLPYPSLIRQDQEEQVYYYIQGKVTPVRPGRYNEAEVIDVPAGVLAAYSRQDQIKTLLTRLNENTPAANLRSGPGLGFEVSGTVFDTDTIVASGRAGDSYWLQVKVHGQEGWLAGDLVKDQGLLSLLPRLEIPQLQPSVSPPPANRARIYTGIGNTSQPQGEGLLVTSLVENGPAQRAGLQVGDIILAIDGQSVSDLPYDEALKHIRGPKGVAVTLSVLRPGTDTQVDVTIVRDEINLNAVAWTCQDQPIRGFGNAWQEHPETHKWLGCPFTNFRRNEHATAAAVQTFEHGWMLWLETDTVANVDPIYVFFEDDGSYVRYGDRPLVDAHSYAPTEPGFYKVGDRFAKVYWEEIGPDGRARLGRATNEARDSKGAFQEFERGRMFWAGEADTIYVIYHGDFDFDLDGETTFIQGWTSYEDTFEALEEK